jgi:hypothetical protein
MLHATATELKSAKFMGTIKVRLRLNLLSMNRNLSVAVWENKRRHNPVGVDEIVCESTQGSLARSATPGFGAQSLWDWTNKSAREKHSIWFMVGEQVRMEQATFHEPRKMTHAHPSP